MEVTISELIKLTQISRKTVSKRLATIGYSTVDKKLYHAHEALSALYLTTPISLQTINKNQLTHLTGFAFQTISKRLDGITSDDNGHYPSKEALAAVLNCDEIDSEDELLDRNKNAISLPAEYDQTRYDYDFYRTKLVRLKTEREQFDLDKERGLYQLKSEISEQLISLIKTIRTRFTGLGSKVVQTITPTDDHGAIEMKINLEVKDVLEDLSHG